MDLKMTDLFKDLPQKLSIITGLVTKTLLSQFNSEESIINPEAQGILSNPADRQKIDEIVQKLKNDPSRNSEKVVLTNNEELIITLH